MQSIHLPTLGLRYWVALCIASIFGANMGDFFARNIGLGHVAGLPFLAAALAIVMIAERFDRMTASGLLLGRDHHRADRGDEFRGFRLRRPEIAAARR